MVALKPMTFNLPITPDIFLGALVLDYALADPWDWYHPVQAMGSVIQRLDVFILNYAKTPEQQRWGGIMLAVILGLGSMGYAAGLIGIASQIHPLLGLLTHIVLLASCLGARSLRYAALEVLEPLEAGDLVEARSRLSRYVGRDTEYLDQSEICRALIETVAENTPDGATAPLLYGVLGGAPLAFGYKAISTLDSMVGYRRDPYTYLGTASAQTEDFLTWLPCRLTVLTLALWSGNPKRFWYQCGQDAVQDPSPNSGWSEAAYAWTLGVQLGGINYYQGCRRDKPLLGRPDQALTVAQVYQSLDLLQRVMWTWVVSLGLMVGVMDWYRLCWFC